MVYFVQKKNRCKNGGCIHYQCAYCCFAAQSSQNTHTLTAKTTQSKDFVNNRTKRGSGGNSYAGYLARRVGQLKCTCDTKCQNK